jgi:ADP-ribosylglycohydrolase
MRLTHSHPTGYLAAGLFADILQRMADRQDSLEHALTESLGTHGHKTGLEETRTILERVLFYFYEGYCPTPQRIDELGGGWVAEEALAIGIWCAFTATSFERGVISAVNHSVDSTGMIAGHFLGIQYGSTAIPARWFEGLELRAVITQISEDIDEVPRRNSGGVSAKYDEMWRRYPGWSLPYAAYVDLTSRPLRKKVCKTC